MLARKTVDYHAWDVPGSRMVVTLKKFASPRGSGESPFIYSSGVSIRSGNSIGFSFFNVSGSDPFTAFESLFALIDNSKSIIFKAIEICDNADAHAKVHDTSSYWKFPRMKDNLTEDLFTSLSVALKKKINSVGISVNRVKYSDDDVGYCCCLNLNNENVFIAHPSSSALDSIAKMKLAVVKAGIMLEKFQGMSWNVMVDSSDPDYDVRSGDGNLLLSRRHENEN